LPAERCWLRSAARGAQFYPYWVLQEASGITACALVFGICKFQRAGRASTPSAATSSTSARICTGSSDKTLLAQWPIRVSRKLSGRSGRDDLQHCASPDGI